MIESIDYGTQTIEFEVQRRKACKNTANSFTSQGIKLVKYNGEALDVNAILKETSASFK